jgi:HEAT repeat protein
MSLLRSPLFWGFVAVVSVVIGFVVRRNASNRSWGFKELVKHPELRAEMYGDEQAVQREAHAAQIWSEAQIARAVRHFAFEVKTSQEGWGEKAILDSLGARVHPAIIAILKDASVRAKLTVPTGTFLQPEAPLNRLCDLLDKHPPSAVVEPLVPFLADPTSRIRKDVALVIGNVGLPESVAPLRKAFADPDEYVRSYALIGLKRAMEEERLDERCQRELFDDLQELIARGENADKAAGLLLEFDAARATEFFLSPAIFKSSSRSLHHALEAMAEEEIPVPRDRLLALISELEASPLEYPRTYTLAGALRLLGQHQQEEDRALLEARTSHAEERVAEGAAAGLIASHGLEGFRERLWDKEDEEGFAALSVPQQHFSAVTMLDSEVNNGGLEQYFVNSSGDHWRDALAGLEAMGFRRRLAHFKEAVKKFGENGPSTDREIRQQQVAKLVRADEAVFDALEEGNEGDGTPEVVDLLAKRYAIQHAEAFR